MWDKLMTSDEVIQELENFLLGDVEAHGAYNIQQHTPAVSRDGLSMSTSITHLPTIDPLFDQLVHPSRHISIVTEVKKMKVYQLLFSMRDQLGELLLECGDTSDSTSTVVFYLLLCMKHPIIQGLLSQKPPFTIIAGWCKGEPLKAGKKLTVRLSSPLFNGVMLRPTAVYEVYKPKSQVWVDFNAHKTEYEQTVVQHNGLKQAISMNCEQVEEDSTTYRFEFTSPAAILNCYLDRYFEKGRKARIHFYVPGFDCNTLHTVEFKVDNNCGKKPASSTEKPTKRQRTTI
jgi:hypothetical protein